MNDSSTPRRPEAGGRRGEDPDVLIVGGGPVGIVLASELLQQGVSIRVIDRIPFVDEDDPHSKGILVWPRSLELLRRIGVSRRMVEAGHSSGRVGYFSDGRLLGSARLDKHPDTPYPFVLTLPQRETERVLWARFAELGGAIERGVELVDLDNADEGGDERPAARLRHADGTLETVRPTYLVGADGPGSTVRTLLGIGFDGEPIDVTYAIGDTAITGDAPAYTGYYYCREGVVALVPLRGGVYRVAANIPHRTEEEGDPPAALLEEVIRRRARIDIRVGEPLWTRSFRPRLGIASAFRAGRCFLAGDSAHAISPAGGQGMNLGLQDAANLAWKLAGVVNGRLDPSILDTYEPERLGGARRMSATSAAQAKFALQRSTLRILRRDAIFLAARAAGVLDRVMVPLLSQTDGNYGEPDTRPILTQGTGRTRVGQRLPLFASLDDEPGGIWPAIDPYLYTVLLWPGERQPAGWSAAVESAHRRYSAQSASVLDLSGLRGRPRRRLLRLLGPDPVLATVRPDGHLAHLAPLSSPDAVERYLRSLAPSPAPVTAADRAAEPLARLA